MMTLQDQTNAGVLAFLTGEVTAYESDDGSGL